MGEIEQGSIERIRIDERGESRARALREGRPLTDRQKIKTGPFVPPKREPNWNPQQEHILD